MPPPPSAIFQWLFASDPAQAPRTLAARWPFLRALGLIFFSAFYSLVRQVNGLIGPDGLLPAQEYLQAIRRVARASRFWVVPTAICLASDSRALPRAALVGVLASRFPGVI